MADLASVFRKKAWELAKADLGLKDNISSGRYFESSFLGFLMTHVREYDTGLAYDEKPAIASYDKGDDIVRGTDLKITDIGRHLLKGYDILRIDPTANFFRKKEMPLITKPDSVLNVGLPGTGLQIRYGLRIGNTNHAFTEPVVVMGLCREGKNSDVSKEDVKASAGSFWNTAVPDMYARQIIQNAAYFRAAVDDMARGVPNDDAADIMVNRGYIESKSKHSGRRYCATYMVKNGEIVSDNVTGEPRIMKTDIPWTSPAAHNVIAVAESIAERDGVKDSKAAAVFDRLLKDVVRDDIDPPMDLITDKVVKFYEQKDMETGFAAAVSTITDRGNSFQL